MGEHFRRLGPKLWVASAFLVWLAAFGSMRANGAIGVGPVAAPAEDSAVVQNPAQAQAQPAGAAYVGEDTCLICHDAVVGTYTDSAHHRVADPRSPAAKQGCETCHGPGSLHAEDPVSVKPMSFKTMTAD